MIDLRRHSRSVFAAAAVLCVAAGAGLADLAGYTQDFEGLTLIDPDALGNDGWLVFGNVSDAMGTPLYGYGPFPAPNGGEAFSAIVTGEGGTEQGTQQLSVYNDYANLDAHNNGDIVEANVYREQTIGMVDVDKVYTFAFDAKLGNIEGSSTAAAFIKVIDPNDDFSLTILLTEDMTTTPVEWTNYSISVLIRADWVGQLLQFGFLSTATSFQGSGIVYDNVTFGEDTMVGVDAASVAPAFALGAASPNPFNPRTTMAFELRRDSRIRLQIFDAAGRLVRTLVDETRLSGEYRVSWDGRDDAMQSVASGTYFARIVADGNAASRRLVLLR